MNYADVSAAFGEDQVAMFACRCSDTLKPSDKKSKSAIQCLQQLMLEVLRTSNSEPSSLNKS